VRRTVHSPAEAARKLHVAERNRRRIVVMDLHSHVAVDSLHIPELVAEDIHRNPARRVDHSRTELAVEAV
jgi:hypothetical protein